MPPARPLTLQELVDALTRFLPAHAEARVRVLYDSGFANTPVTAVYVSEPAKLIVLQGE